MASLLLRMLSRIFSKPARAQAPAIGKWRKELVDRGQLDGIRLRSCQVAGGCRSACCDKGVRMPKVEAGRIVRFVEEHPEHY